MNIIEQLKEKGITKYQIAKKLGVHWNTVNMWDRNVFKPTDENLKKLDELLKNMGDI